MLKLEGRSQLWLRLHRFILYMGVAHLTKGCQYLFKGALLLSYNAMDYRLFLRFFLSPLLIPSWQPSRPYRDMSSQLCTNQFRSYSSYITDWSGTLFKKFILSTSKRSKWLMPLLALLLTSMIHPSCTLHDSRLVAGSSFWKLSSWKLWVFLLQKKTIRYDYH